MKTASSAAVGASKKLRMSMAMPCSALIRATTRVASNELPPSSKKPSSAPTRSCPSRSAKIATTPASVGVAGSRYSTVFDTNSGVGKAFRSSLPLALSGNSSSSTNMAGIM